MTIVSKTGTYEISDESLIAQAYRALQTAAGRIGRNNAADYIKQNKKNRGRGYRITAEHEEVVKAMPKVLSGEMTPEEAMGLINSYDILKQRIG